jgi:hypothetical protein
MPTVPSLSLAKGFSSLRRTCFDKYTSHISMCLVSSPFLPPHSMSAPTSTVGTYPCILSPIFRAPAHSLPHSLCLFPGKGSLRSAATGPAQIARSSVHYPATSVPLRRHTPCCIGSSLAPAVPFPGTTLPILPHNRALHRAAKVYPTGHVESPPTVTPSLYTPYARATRVGLLLRSARPNAVCIAVNTLPPSLLAKKKLPSLSVLQLPNHVTGDRVGCSCPHSQQEQVSARPPRVPCCLQRLGANYKQLVTTTNCFQFSSSRTLISFAAHAY